MSAHREWQGFAAGRDGTPLFYRLNGRADGAALPVVFSDGIGCNGFSWKYLEPELCRERTILHWHYRGHGRTPPPRDRTRVTVTDAADDLLAVLDDAHVGRAVLAGYSMGVQVSLEAWRRGRDRVAGLVLLCGPYGTPLRTFKGTRVLEELLPLARLTIHRMPRFVSALWSRAVPTDLAFQIATLFEINGPLIRREDFFPYLEHLASLDPRLFIDMLTAASRHTTREILPLVDVPTLIIAGEQDSFTPIELAREMHELIPRSQLLVVEGGTHTTPIERPGEVTSAVVSFLRTFAS